jgi:hypothetical protein
MGGVAKAVGDVFSGAAEAVGDAFESVGTVVSEVVEGTAKVIDDAGTWIDDSIIQPIKENPIETAVMIAAVAYGGPAAASFLGSSLAVGTAVAAGTASAGIAASKGASIEETLRAGAIGAGAGAVTGGVATAASPTIGTAAGRIVGGAAGGATAAVASGRDPLQGAAIGAASAGIGEAVNLGVNTAADAIRNVSLPTTTQAPTYEFGFRDPGAGTGDFGIKPTMPSDYSGVGFKAPVSAPVTPLYANYGNIQTDQIGTKGTSKEFGLDPSKDGGIGIKYDPDSASTYGQLDPALPAGGVPPTYVLGSETSAAKEQLKKTAGDLIKNSLLNELFGGNQDPLNYLTFRLRGRQFGDEFFGGEADTSLALTQVQPDKFELRKFANPEGQSTLISFKGDKPQQPIPTGYEEVETIGAAEGGLISTNMVKYSKKPLLAKRKPDVEKKVTTRKGLAGRKS